MISQLFQRALKQWYLFVLLLIILFIGGPFQLYKATDDQLLSVINLAYQEVSLFLLPLSILLVGRSFRSFHTPAYLELTPKKKQQFFIQDVLFHLFVMIIPTFLATCAMWTTRTTSLLPLFFIYAVLLVLLFAIYLSLSYTIAFATVRIVDFIIGAFGWLLFLPLFYQALFRYFNSIQSTIAPSSSWLYAWSAPFAFFMQFLGYTLFPAEGLQIQLGALLFWMILGGISFFYTYQYQLYKDVPHKQRWYLYPLLLHLYLVAAFFFIFSLGRTTGDFETEGIAAALMVFSYLIVLFILYQILLYVIFRKARTIFIGTGIFIVIFLGIVSLSIPPQYNQGPPPQDTQVPKVESVQSITLQSVSPNYLPLISTVGAYQIDAPEDLAVVIAYHQAVRDLYQANIVASAPYNMYYSFVATYHLKDGTKLETLLTFTSDGSLPLDVLEDFYNLDVWTTQNNIIFSNQDVDFSLNSLKSASSPTYFSFTALRPLLQEEAQALSFKKRYQGSKYVSTLYISPILSSTAYTQAPDGMREVLAELTITDTMPKTSAYLKNLTSNTFTYDASSFCDTCPIKVMKVFIPSEYDQEDLHIINPTTAQAYYFSMKTKDIYGNTIPSVDDFGKIVKPQYYQTLFEQSYSYYMSEQPLALIYLEYENGNFFLYAIDSTLLLPQYFE